MENDKKPRHVLGISGGKDSAALAIYLKDRVPEMEYFFTDTEKELPETYEFVDKLEAFLGKPVVRLNNERGFDHHLAVFRGYLPSSRMRWCTRLLKLRPFEDWIGDDPVISYVGIRADEDREGYISTKPNIKAVFPFKEDGINKADVFRILEESGVGIPEYYKWRSRSGCYFCFFQRKSEWVGLYENHPSLFAKAMEYEKTDPDTGKSYTWQQGESLSELINPTRIEEIRTRMLKEGLGNDGTLSSLFKCEEEDEDNNRACLICDL